MVNGIAARPISPAGIARLCTQPWRGNVRELENIVHRAVLLAEGADIGPADFELGAQTVARPALFSGGLRIGGIAGLVGQRMEEVERALIIETLSHTLGNRTHAAVILGISIRALRNKLRDYTQAGIAVPPHTSALPASSRLRCMGAQINLHNLRLSGPRSPPGRLT